MESWSDPVHPRQWLSAFRWTEHQGADGSGEAVLLVLAMVAVLVVVVVVVLAVVTFLIYTFIHSYIHL